MSLRRLLVPLVSLLLLGPGCGGDSSSGGGASTQASGFLTINAPTDVIKCGACQPFTATYTRGGVAQTVTPTWRTDNPAVATIDGSGQLTPIAHGDVTVTAEYQEARASKLVHVVNDYGATWYGNYLITRCAASGDFERWGWCDPDGFGAGQTLLMAMELQQDRDRVTGTFWLGGLDGPFTGAVASGGNLTGEAKYTYTYDDGAVLDILVSPLSVLREGDRITQGHFTVVFSMVWMSGNCTFDGRVMGLDIVPSGRSGLRLTSETPRTLRDVLRLMRQR
jgi:hypothetical protein